MQPAKPKSNAPFSFELGAETAAKILDLTASHPDLSNTKLVEHALRRFNYEKVVEKEAGRRQFSVRLPEDLRAALEEHSKAKKVSVGQLIRFAIEDFAGRSPKKLAKELKQLTSEKIEMPALFEEAGAPKKKKSGKGGKKKG